MGRLHEERQGSAGVIAVSVSEKGHCGYDAAAQAFMAGSTGALCYILPVGNRSAKERSTDLSSSPGRASFRGRPCVLWLWNLLEIAPPGLHTVL